MSLNYTLTPQSITIIDEQKNVHTLQIGDKFQQVLAMIKAGKIKKILTLLSPKAATEYVLKGIKIVSDTSISYNGKIYDEKEYCGLIDYIIECSKSKLPYEYLLKFLDNLALNPDAYSRINLFKFLQQTGIKITENGYIAGVKSVNAEYKSHHDGTTLHKVGTFVSFPREKCNSNPSDTCSYGLHTGGSRYVNSFSDSGSHILVTIIHPRDVVCVPNDYSWQKMRACLYYVAGELTNEEWSRWDKSVLAPKYNSLFIDFDKNKLVNEKKEFKKVEKSVEKQNKKVAKKTDKTNKVWVLSTISRNRLSLPSSIVKLIHAAPGDDLFVVIEKNTIYLYKKLPKSMDEECVYKVDRDNQVCISEVRLKEIGGGMFFKVSINNNAITVQKGNHN